MTQEFSKRIKGAIRELAATTHEREVRGLLQPIARTFAAWEEGKLGTWDLVEQMHQFMRGPSRQLFDQYNRRSLWPMLVAGAIARGLLSEEEVPSDVLAALEDLIAFRRQGLDEETTSCADDAE